MLVAITPSRREFPDGAQWSFIALEICNIPAELSFFSRMGLCSLDLLIELTQSLLCPYNDPWGAMSLHVSQSA